MRVEYVCKYCQHQIGTLERPEWTYAEAEQRLGVSSLTPTERLEFVSYQPSGSMRVQTVCDHCQQAVENNPQLLVEGKLLQ